MGKRVKNSQREIKGVTSSRRDVTGAVGSRKVRVLKWEDFFKGGPKGDYYMGSRRSFLSSFKI